MTIATKRVYDPPDDGDGTRVLIDRLWPRGLSKEAAKLDYWARDCAPSTELRQWYRHDLSKWQEFQRRYFDELDSNPDAFQQFSKLLPVAKITLLFSAREATCNNAAAFKAYLELKGYGD